MAFVLDASTALSWCLPDETLNRAEHLFAELAESPALAPAIWPLEVGNALRTAHRRGRLTAEQLREATAILAEIPIDLVTLGPTTVFTQVLPLALAQDVSVYDAAYLVVAQLHQVPVATVDGRLAEVARTIGIPVL
jgi:predicted nucleic acid-binding protein